MEALANWIGLCGFPVDSFTKAHSMSARKMKNQLLGVYCISCIKIRLVLFATF